MAERPRPQPPDREWVSFEDDDEARTWVFDVTFLMSSWTCIFGQGCQGVLTGPAPELVQGCCSYGAHFTGADDVARIEAAAATLGPAHWQNHRQGRSRGVIKVTPGGETVTRMVGGACIFLNRPDFPAGAGCALHQAAAARGERPMDLKPDVCWQVPLRRDDREDGDGHVTTTVTEWGRRHWGAGGAEFHWWCTEAPEAFTADRAVYRSMADELTGLVGEGVYRRLVTYLDSRLDGGVSLPHPTVRRP